MAYEERARFYPIAGQQFPSVTTALDVISKPALAPWYAKEERRVFETALLDVLSQPGAHDPEWVLGELSKAVQGVKAGERQKQKAGSIGTAAHALVEWHTRKQMGEKVGPEPVVPDAALWAVEAWKDWAKAVDFTPLAVERVVHCAECGYAGKMDWLAKVEGIVTLGDIKTGKAIYPEAFLQNRAYRHAARRQGLDSEQGVILRLPKVVEDPTFEAMLVPDTPLEDFLAALRLWRWQRRMEGKPVGYLPPAGVVP